MRYYEVVREKGKYKVQIYKILFSALFPVFTGYTDNVKAVNTMLNEYSSRTHTILNTVAAYKYGGNM